MIQHEFNIKQINRIIAHKIYPKTKKKEAETELFDELLNFQEAEKQTLTIRLIDALTKFSKSFRLDFADTKEDSIHYHLQEYPIYRVNDDKFINMSCSLAEKLAESQKRISIPGGYCIVGDGLTESNQYFVFVIKAELQEVFNITENNLEIIKNVFLSPAKDFYKIGYFIQDASERFIPYMYDDQFNSQSTDLTEYFYKSFLGLTTSNNDKILSKGFYNDCVNFFNKNISGDKDKMWLLRALNVLYREDSSGLISPKNFSETYLSDTPKLKKSFDLEIVEKKYPRSFTKNKSLLENKLALERITIGKDVVITKKGSGVVNIIEGENLQELSPILNNGMKHKIIVLSTQNEN